MTQHSRPPADVRLDQIDISGYRSCLETTFRPNRELSTLIGINGSGKTNILQAIRLLKPPHGRSLRQRAELLGQRAESEIAAWFRISDSVKIGLRIRLSIVESSRRTDELVAVSELWNFQDITQSKAWKSLPPWEFFDKKFFEKFQRLYDLEVDHITAGEMVLDPAIIGNHDVVNAIFAVTDFRSRISYYSASQFTDPTKCPSSFEVDENGRPVDTYGPTTSHLKFLQDLYHLKQTNKLRYEEYCSFVSKQQLGLISTLTWKEIELSSSTAEVRSGGKIKKIRRKKTLVIPKVRVGSSHMTFNQLSEGTFKTLALAFYVINDESKLLMIEEPEVCVHHGLLSRVVDTIRSHAGRKQILVSTHSDLLIDRLDPESIFVVEMSKGTSVEPLNEWLGTRGKEALRTYLSESGSLGEYWRSGGFS